MRKSLVCLAFAAIPFMSHAQSWTGKGQWYAPYDWDICAIHLTLLPDKRLIAWNWNRDRTAQQTQIFKVVTIGDSTGDPNPLDYKQVTNVTWPWTDHEIFHDHEPFCAGTTLLNSGKLLLAGGHKLSNVGIDKVKLFDWQTNTFEEMFDMTTYPTLETTENGLLVPNGNRDAKRRGCVPIGHDGRHPESVLQK